MHPPAMSFGTLGRPRLRSAATPWGFAPSCHPARQRNRLALTNLVASRRRVMFRLGGFRRLAGSGGLTRLCSCNFGSPFKRPVLLLHNKPWLLELGGPCRCGFAGRHLVAQGRMSQADLQVCGERCIPSAAEVFGCEPRVGQPRAGLAAKLPGPLCQRIASGAAAANGQAPSLFPLSASWSAAAALGNLEPLQLDDSFPGEPGYAPFFEDPDWVVELASSLAFRERLRYRFKNLRRRLSSSRPAGFSCDPWHLAPQPKGGAAARQPGHQQGASRRAALCAGRGPLSWGPSRPF